MFCTFPPPPSLTQFVDCFWVHEEDRAVQQKERALPGGTTEMVFDLSDNEVCSRLFDRKRPNRSEQLAKATLHGAQSDWYILGLSPTISHIGVHFKPGGSTPFLEVPASDLHNKHAPLEALWGRSAWSLREQLLEAPTSESRVHLLAQSLLAHSSHHFKRHPAVAQSLQAFCVVPQLQMVAEVAKQSGLSHRRFIAVFREDVGLTPKEFCRVRRFQRVIRGTRNNIPASWGQLARACGYYDQAHLINEFKSFAGLCPSAYLRKRDSRFPSYVPLALAEVNFFQDSPRHAR